jgi:hypothetical protein
MFQWSKLGQICELFSNSGKVYIDETPEQEL